jgi:hypothetical protein
MASWPLPPGLFEADLKAEFLTRVSDGGCFAGIADSGLLSGIPDGSFLTLIRISGGLGLHPGRKCQDNCPHEKHRNIPLTGTVIFHVCNSLPYATFRILKTMQF